MIAGLLGGQIDLCNQVQFATGRAVFNNSKVQIFSTRGATHREICLRVNLKNPIKSNLVRQAMALTLDRPSIVKKLFNGFADIGNDSPFAPVYPSTNKSVPQRHEGHREGEAADGAGRLPEGLLDQADDREDGRDPAARADLPELREGRSGSTCRSRS